MSSRLLYSGVLTALLLTAGSAIAQAPALPNGYAPWELDLLDSYIPYKTTSGITSPPELPVRASAEWEEIDALLVTWTGYTNTIREIVRYAQEECEVYILCADTNTVKTSLESASIPLDNITLVEGGFNSVWARDYGQWNVYANDVDSLYLIDWIYNRPRPLDDAVPELMSQLTGLPIYTTTEVPYDLVHTGGNFMTDGWGTGFSSRLVLDENDGNDYSLEPKTEGEIDYIMDAFMGISTYIKMETLPYDQIHHIDMHMKLLDEETILVGEYPEGEADGPQIEANIEYIQDNYTSIFGTPYKFERILMPPDEAGNFPDDGSWWNPGDYRTYTNFVFINKTVIVPAYEEQYDTTAYRILSDLLPGYRIVMIDCNEIIQALGAIHCVTKEVATNEPLLITHQPLQDTEELFADYEVDAWILHRDGIAEAEIFYTTDTAAGFWNTSPMTLADVASNTWTGFIPAQEDGAEVFYYIYAQATTGKEQVRPITAPDGFWHFRVGGAISNLEESHDDLIAVWPNPVDDHVSIDLRYLRSADKWQLSLTEPSGKEVYAATAFGGQIIHLPLALLPSGTYWISLRSGDACMARQIVKR